VLIVGHNAHLIPHSHAESILHRIVTSTSVAAVSVSALLVGAFLLGNVMTSVCDPLVYRAGRLCRQATYKFLSVPAKFKWMPGHKRAPVRAHLFMSRTRAISNNARGLVMDADGRILAKVGVPGSAALMFPLEHVLASLPFIAPQLAQSAPTQYQEYDRLRAEVDFRIAIVPPLIVLACVLPFNARPWLIVAVAICGAVLLMQSVGQGRASMDILANAAYLGYASAPIVQSVADYLAQLESPPGAVGEWVAAMIIGLDKTGFFDERETMLEEATELNEDDFELALAYLIENDADLAVEFQRWADPEGLDQRDAGEAGGEVAPSPSSPDSLADE
jgi:hypothetical protein